jgi:glycerol-3-phosphate O-acyltransferase
MLFQMHRNFHFAEIENLACRLMTGIRQIVPVLPISLVATVIIEDGRRGLSAFEVEARVNRLIEQLQAGGAPVYVTTKSRVETILNALGMLKIRRLVIESDGIYQAAPGEDDILAYYANSIAHWMPEKIA